MIEKYAKICDLLEQLGQFRPRLDQIQQIIQDPDFKYEKTCCPEILENTFLTSSYWLDRELFDDSYLYKTQKQDLLPMQEAHLKLTDVGVALLNKGFPLEYHPEKFKHPGPHQLATYAKVFSEQCHKRRTFLNKIVLYQNQQKNQGNS